MTMRILAVSAVFVLFLGSQASLLAAGDVAKGEKMYKAKCASCHGSDAKGNAVMEKGMKLSGGALNLVDEATLGKSDAELSAVIEKGVGAMPAYKGKIKPTEIGDILAYLRGLVAGLGPGQGQEQGTKATPAADIASLYLKNCASCHGKNGKGNATLGKAFKLTPEALDLTDDGTQNKKDDELGKIIESGAGKMPGFKGKLSEASVKDLIAFMRVFNLRKGDKP